MSIFLIVSLIFIFLGGLGAIMLSVDQFRGTELLKKQVNEGKDSVIERLESENLELQSKIADLKLTTTNQNIELKKKQKRIEDLSKSNLKFSENIKIITDNTNRILKALKREHALKGNLKLQAKDFENYKIILGGVAISISPEEELTENTNFIWGIPVSFVLFDNRMYISIELRNVDGDLIFEMKNGDWSIIDDSVIFSFNYDDTGLEIINSKGQIQLQIFLYQNRVIVNGAFPQKDGVVIVNGGNTNFIKYNDPRLEAELISHYMKLSRIFIHHGSNYIGVRNKK